MLPPWLENSGAALCSGAGSNMEDIFSDLNLKATSSSTDQCTAALFIQLLDELTASDWHPDDPLSLAQVSDRLKPVLASTAKLLRQQMPLCEHDLQRAREHDHLGTMDVLGRGGAISTLPYVRIVNPEAHTGILAKYLRT